jgi:CheY-like chemotaxis protein
MQDLRQPASTPVRILIVEDQPADAELMVEALQDSGFDVSWQLVSTEGAYRDALGSGIDVILCDHSLPSFDAGRAFELLQQARLPIPLLVVSGLITEELATEYIQRGAYDFVGKDHLGYLGAAVRGALERGALEREAHTSTVRIDAPMHELDGHSGLLSTAGEGAPSSPQADEFKPHYLSASDARTLVDPLLDKALANVRVTKDGYGKGVCLDLKGIYVYSNGVIVQFADGMQLPYNNGKEMLMEMDYLLQKAQVRADEVAKQRKA